MYFSIIKPDAKTINTVIAAKKQSKFTYPEIGASRFAPHPPDSNPLPHHYRLLHRRCVLGKGKEVYARAKTAFVKWGMYQLSWLEPCWPETPLSKDVDVAMLGKVLGMWWLNVNRIIYTIQEEEGPVERFGFAYGTLHGCSVSGEERVMIEWNHQDNSVYYDLFSFSQANLLITKLSVFYLHALQERFAKESSHAMLQYCQ